MNEENAHGSRIHTSNVFPAGNQEIVRRAAQVFNSSNWQEKTPGSQKPSICLWPCRILEFSLSLEAGLATLG